MDDDTRHDGKDQLMLGTDLGGGLRPYVRHLPDHTLDSGFCVPIVEGQPLNGAAVVRIKASEHEGVFDVESLYEPNRPEGSGPVKANSKAFLSGWDRIFGGQPTIGSA